MLAAVGGGGDVEGPLGVSDVWVLTEDEPVSADRLDAASVLHHADFHVAVAAALKQGPQPPRPACVLDENEGELFGDLWGTNMVLSCEAFCLRDAQTSAIVPRMHLTLTSSSC